MIRKLVQSVIYGKKATSDKYIQYLRRKGARIGERVTFFVPTKTIIDETRPWLISIGDDVQITEGVTILTHGYDWSVTKGVYGDVLGSSGEVSIGNNVFIGVNSTILKGVHIGNNVIIGAMSLVNKDVPDNCVVAGNPARFIMSIDTYHERRKEAQIKEATELVRLYRERYHKEPDAQALHEFFWLFSTGDEQLPDVWERQMDLHGNKEFSYSVMRNQKPPFKNMEDFLNSIK